jgi:hypothetical protein
MMEGSFFSLFFSLLSDSRCFPQPAPVLCFQCCSYPCFFPAIRVGDLLLLKKVFQLHVMLCIVRILVFWALNSNPFVRYYFIVDVSCVVTSEILVRF